jgi:hypothetical protein
MSPPLWTQVTARQAGPAFSSLSSRLDVTPCTIVDVRRQFAPDMMALLLFWLVPLVVGLILFELIRWLA